MIIVLVSFNDKPQQFRYEDQRNAGGKTIHRIECGGCFPWKFHMLMDEEVDDNEYAERYEEISDHPIFILRFVEKTELFHLNALAQCLPYRQMTYFMKINARYKNPMITEM
jgi:hypothetical protein